MAYNKNNFKNISLQISDIFEGYSSKFSHKIVQQDVDAFCSLTGDFNPVHLDADYAKETSIGKPIVHGMLTSSFISTMVGMFLPGQGALWTSQTLEFIHPVFVGDEITVEAEVKRIFHDKNAIVLQINISNQKNKVVVTGESRVNLLQSSKDKKKPEIINNSTNVKKSNVNIKTKNEICLILGGSGGIGEATARELSIKGFRVGITYFRGSENAHRIVEDIKNEGFSAACFQIDLSSPDYVKELFDQIENELNGRITKLVCCAAPEPVPTAIKDLEWATFVTHLNIQVGSAFSCVKQMTSRLNKGDDGAVVLIGSLYGQGKAPSKQAAYVTIKAALAGFGRALAEELGPEGVRVNTVAPGITQTQMTANIPQKAKLIAKMNTPLRRLADPQDIACAVAFLLSASARHISGETLTISGGL